MPKKRPITNSDVQANELQHLDRMSSWADKRQIGYAYYSIGITQASVLSHFLKVTEDTVGRWLPEYEETFQVVSKERIKFMAGNVTEIDYKRWMEIQVTQNNIIDDINLEIKQMDKINDKIDKFVTDIMDKEDLSELEVKQALAILKHFKDKDKIRKDKVELLIKVKSQFATDSGIDTELEMRKERTKLVDKIIVSEKVKEFTQERKDGKPLAEGAYHARVTEANKEAKKFLEIHDM